MSLPVGANQTPRHCSHQNVGGSALPPAVVRCGAAGLDKRSSHPGRRLLAPTVGHLPPANRRRCHRHFCRRVALADRCYHHHAVTWLRCSRLICLSAIPPPRLSGCVEAFYQGALLLHNLKMRCVLYIV